MFVKHQDAPITSGFRLIGCSHTKNSTSRYFYVLKLSTICSWEKLEGTANDLANVLKSYRIRLPPFILPRKNLYWNLKALFIDILNWSSFSFNKLEFKEHPQRIRKPISDQNFFIWFHPWCWTVMQKMKSKDHVILEVLIYKDQAIWLTESILGSKFKIQTIKLLQITEWICYFYGCLPICIKSASYLNSVLTYSRFKIGNYYGHAQVFLTTPIWIDWIIIDVFVYT